MVSLKKSNQVCTSSLSDKNHGRSKAQICLKKILDFISSHPSTLEILACGKRGFDVDLNLRLGPGLESENENQGLSACSFVGEDDGGRVCEITVNCTSSLVVFGDVSRVDKSCEGEELLNSRVVVEDETKELSDITNPEVSSSEIEAKQTCEHVQQSHVKAGKRKKQLEEKDVGVEVGQHGKLLRTREGKSEGYLDLLVEAARLISGNFEDDDGVKSPENQTKEETQSIAVTIALESKVDEKTWVLDCYEGGFEDISPVIRSKRGRNQVLPYRYRDSILDPWKPLSGTKRRSSRVFVAKHRTK